MKLINKILQKRGYYSSYESAYVCFVAQEIANEMFENNKISIISYKNGKLKIRTKNNYIATDLKLRQNEFIEKINQKAKIQIKKICF